MYSGDRHAKRAGLWPELIRRNAARKIGQRGVFAQSDGSVINGEIKFRGVLKEDPDNRIWLGIELADAVGRHSGRGYFSCGKSRGLFVCETPLNPIEGTPQQIDDGTCPEPFSIVLYDGNVRQLFCRRREGTAPGRVSRRLRALGV
eukprot:3675816-Prymnesium_polylepis.1